MEILKAFAADNRYLTVEKVKYLQIAFTVLHFVFVGGLYGTVGYIGRPAPSFLAAWNSYGYKVFVITCLLYQTVHSIFISHSVNRQVERRKELLGNKPSSTNDELRILYYLAVVGLCLTWIGAVLWVLSAFKGPHAAAMETIGNSMGYGLGIFLTATYKYVRAVNQQKGSKVKSSTAKNSEVSKVTKEIGASSDNIDKSIS
ncbi:hypothetical protein HDV01_005773 [Terramyces sp. JEL0728]|nr:hypothetical protein HDV01_005773 [Terramyces sp. JEL0728]